MDLGVDYFVDFSKKSKKIKTAGRGNGKGFWNKNL
jgi:hypothetical protein